MPTERRFTIYVNGILEAPIRAEGAPLAIKSPARMYIAAGTTTSTSLATSTRWRISRSPLALGQTAIRKPETPADGCRVTGATGDAFTVPRLIHPPRREDRTVTAKPVARKRSTGFSSGTARTPSSQRTDSRTPRRRPCGCRHMCVLQLRAVYATEVKTQRHSVTIKEEIPSQPSRCRHLRGGMAGIPSKWCRRSVISPHARPGRGELHYRGPSPAVLSSRPSFLTG